MDASCCKAENLAASFPVKPLHGGISTAMAICPMEGDLVAFVRDNTGNLLELIQRPDF